ncbi:hypothetical protein [Marinifilum sp. D737]|uniref:hypothetical protein n=1 Tax=Marinifilum sp. D737 TaxID=2969628 RepID=UPI00227663AE|nr:hypothetical protein [Marinifilum sp. D737]MCY1633520.1 hypothetical protein [Marinifilum sp. D737]
MIYPCKERQFLGNTKEITSYFSAKNKYTILKNTDRLIDLIEICFSTLLFYNVRSSKRFIINIKGLDYKIEFNGTELNGNKSDVVLELSEAVDSIVRSVFIQISYSINEVHFKKLQKLLISIFETKNISLSHKLNILNFENESLKDNNQLLLFRIEEKTAIKSISSRIKLVYSLFIEQQTLSTVENPEVTYNVFENFIKSSLRVFISRNHFTEGINFIKDELDRFEDVDPAIELDESKIVFILLSNLVTYNNLFQLISKEELKELIDDYKTFLNEEHSRSIYNDLDFNPNNFEIKDFSINLADPKYKNIDLNNINTIIYFIIHDSNTDDYQEIKIDNNSIFIKKINNLFDDPVFAFLDKLRIQIDGMPVSVFSDSIGNLSSSHLLGISIPDFYHPDFDVIDEKVVEKDLSLEKATRGGSYHPHKDFIVETLLKLHDSGQLPFTIEKRDITSSLISNYLVMYLNQNTPIDQRLYTITNFDSYFRIKNKYFENINQFEFDEINNLGEFIRNTEILNDKQFLSFCYALLEKTIKKSIEVGGLHKNMWTEKKGINHPIMEVLAQRIIYNTIRHVAEMKGVQISRETISSNGSLDFFFQYTKNDRSYRVCVELKNAHHDHVDEGNCKQLTEYIKDTGKKEGIYLVLWYKGDNFNKPTKYDSIDELQKKLDFNLVKPYRIKNMIIDCSWDKTSPSVKGKQ